MNLLDVNVLVALFRPEHEFHTAASAWWAESMARGEALTVPDAVWVGFIRLVTNSRVFSEAASLADAGAFQDAVEAQPSYLSFRLHPRTMAEMRRLGAQASARGDFVSDAYIAACASVYGGTVVTFDRDFRKFDGVKVLELAV